MKGTMAVFSARGKIPDHRYDFAILPSGLGYYRYQTSETHSRWKRTDVRLTGLPVSPDAELVAGPVLIEITEAEAEEIVRGGTMHPPRNVGLRAEKVRTNWNGAHLPVSRLDSWLTDWRDAARDNNHLWIGARTHRHGRVRQQNPFALGTTSLATEKTALTAVTSATGAVTPVPTPELTAAIEKSHAYEPIIKGVVRRPNGEGYRVRKIGRKTDVDVLRQTRERGGHTITLGQPGCGKTALVEAAFGEQMITVMGSEDVEAADFLGGYVENEAGNWEWIDGPLPMCMENGWILYVDEIGVVRQKQMSTLYSVMDGRNSIRITANPKRGVVTAQPGFAVVASTNPDSQEVRLTDALLNRFALKLSVATDFKMAREFDVPEWLINAAENLELRRRNKELSWAPQMRDLLLFKENLEILGNDGEAAGSIVNSAPAAARATVAEVLSKTLGKKIKPLELV